MLPGLLTIAMTVLPPIKVLLIDTGAMLDSRMKSYIVNDIKDGHGHGTAMASLIALGEGADDPACSQLQITVCKALVGADPDVKKCLDKVAKDEYDFINISGGGGQKDEGELAALKRITKGKTVVVVAAGNASSELGFTYKFYPASHKYEDLLPNLVVAGNGYSETKRYPNSNYGKKMVWRDGNNILAIKRTGKIGYISGTSVSAALITHDYVMERCRAATNRR